MSVQWISVASGVPNAVAAQMQSRLEAAGISILAAESATWIGKLRAFVEGAPDMSLLVDKPEVERAKALVADLTAPPGSQLSIESYIQSLTDEQIKQVLAHPGWPDLILDPAKQVLRERTVPPAPVPRADDKLPLIALGLSAVLGPLGSWIARQIIPRAQPWEDRMIPLYDEATQIRSRQFITRGLGLFVSWIALLFVVKCVK